MTDKTTGAYVELSFGPVVELIPFVRKFVTDFYLRVVADRDAVSRVALATHELLENAVRYSVDGETRVRIEVPQDKKNTILVRTWNRTNPAHIEVVKGMFEDMLAEKDAFAYYQKMMRRTAKLEDESGLGLARIRAEADMDLKYSVDDGFLCIHAEMHVGEHK